MRRAVATYADLFHSGGAAAFSGTGLLARMPISMLGIGTVLMVSGITGRYAVAGALSGTIAFAGALVMPQLGRLVDRFGQATVLVPSLLVHAVGLLTTVVAVRSGWPEWTWYAGAAVAGASLPSIGAMVRARWAHALPEPGRRQTAFAFESVLDEVIFVTGPPLAALLATTVAPEAGLLAALAFALVGGLLFAGQRHTQPPVGAVAGGRSRQRLVSAGLLAVCATFCGAGVVFGAVEVIVVAFADEQGVTPAAGLVLACYAGGSLLSGLFYGARRWTWGLRRRFVVSAVCFGVITSLPLLAGRLAVLAPLILLTGLAIAPVLIGGATLVERLVPRAALTEGLTWSTTALVLGVTAGAAASGPIIDSAGARPAFLLPAAAAAATAVVCVLASPALRAADAADISDLDEPHAVDRGRGPESCAGEPAIAARSITGGPVEGGGRWAEHRGEH